MIGLFERTMALSALNHRVSNWQWLRCFTNTIIPLQEDRPMTKRLSDCWHSSTTSFLLLATLLLVQPAAAQDWLQWGGPHGDFTVGSTGLAETWPVGGPRQLWKRPLGEGYASILYYDGKLFTTYSEGDSEIVVSLDAQSGGTIWEHRYGRKFWPDMTQQFGPGPNATPLIVGDRIIAIGIDGQVRCLNLTTGKMIWKHALPTEYGRRKRVEEYGYSSSPLLYGHTVIVQVGGDDHAVVAFKPDDGSVAWKSEPGGVSYAASTIMKLAGRDQYIYFSPEGVNGLDPSTGKLLWHAPIEFNNGNHLTPAVKCDENHLWVGSQFASGGGRLLKIESGHNGMEVEQLWFQRKLQASHWTMVRIGEFIYGSVGGNRTSFLACFNWKTGKLAWRKRGFHKAQALYADDKLLFLDEDGKLTIARVTPENLEVLDTAQVTESISWTLPTLVSTKLFLRDKKNIIALDLAKGGG